MKSLADLQALASANGLPVEGTREQLMDRLRNKFGTFDPSMQIDPMKAVDLKNQIDWSAADYGLARYLNASYALEPKLDGARMRLFLGGEKNSMNTGRRSEKNFAYIDRSDNFPHLRDAVIPEFAGTILDGEAVAPSEKIITASGVSTNSLLNATVALVNVNPADSVKVQAVYGKVRFVVFDVLALQGSDVRHCTYIQRREMLEQVVPALRDLAPEIELILSMDASPDNLRLCFEHGFEGGMLKAKSGLYEAGKRSRSWAKVKQSSTADAFIVGYVPGEGRNAGKVGAVALAVFNSSGEAVPVAQPGAFTDAFRDELSASDGSLKESWYGKVIEFSGQGLTKENRVRHPHMVRLRPDKDPRDCDWSQLDVFARV